MSKDDAASQDDVANKVRELLALWDAGSITGYEFENSVHEATGPTLGSSLGEIEAGKTVLRMGSCCCSSHPPVRRFLCLATIEPHGYRVRRVDAKDDFRLEESVLTREDVATLLKCAEARASRHEHELRPEPAAQIRKAMAALEWMIRGDAVAGAGT